MKWSPQTSPPLCGTTGTPWDIAQVEDAEPFGNAAAPRDVRLPDVQGTSLGDGLEAEARKLVLPAGDLDGLDEGPDLRLLSQQVGGENVLEPVDIEPGDGFSHTDGRLRIPCHVAVGHDEGVVAEDATGAGSGFGGLLHVRICAARGRGRTC